LLATKCRTPNQLKLDSIHQTLQGAREMFDLSGDVFKADQESWIALPTISQCTSDNWES